MMIKKYFQAIDTLTSVNQEIIMMYQQELALGRPFPKEVRSQIDKLNKSIGLLFDTLIEDFKFEYVDDNGLIKIVNNQKTYACPKYTIPCLDVPLLENNPEEDLPLNEEEPSFKEQEEIPEIIDVKEPTFVPEPETVETYDITEETFEKTVEEVKEEVKESIPEEKVEEFNVFDFLNDANTVESSESTEEVSDIPFEESESQEEVTETSGEDSIFDFLMQSEDATVGREETPVNAPEPQIEAENLADEEDMPVDVTKADEPKEEKIESIFDFLDSEPLPEPSTEETPGEEISIDDLAPEMDLPEEPKEEASKEVREATEDYKTVEIDFSKLLDSLEDKKDDIIEEEPEVPDYTKYLDNPEENTTEERVEEEKTDTENTFRPSDKPFNINEVGLAHSGNTITSYEIPGENIVYAVITRDIIGTTGRPERIPFMIAPIEIIKGSMSVPIICSAYYGGRFYSKSSIESKNEGQNLLTMKVGDYEFLIRGKISPDGQFQAHINTTGLSIRNNIRIENVPNGEQYYGRISDKIYDNGKAYNGLYFLRNEKVDPTNYFVYPLSDNKSDEFVIISQSQEFIDYYICSKTLVGTDKIYVNNNGEKEEISAGWDNDKLKATITEVIYGSQFN